MRKGVIKLEDRNYIINRITSKKTTVNEFKFDSLTAPPIASMFTMNDIHQLHKIATSIRYAGNPNKKYKLIDEIMRSRGFVKFVSGTNRVTYRHPENNSFIVKVAFDDVGLKDNPKEFKNQFRLKPFCTKVFEVTQCGTLGVFERVNPITSREEFCSAAADIYNVISYWLIGEYILEDIGTKFFMNWGIRDGFGPVLLDYPYLYELDGNKLYCKAPSQNSPSGCCDGIIDYDDGFNYLYCTKCGARYRATELAKAIKNNDIIKGKGETKMKIRVSGGSKNVNKMVEAGKFAGMATSIPNKRYGNHNTNKPTNNKNSRIVRVSINEDKAETVYRSDDYKDEMKVSTSKKSKKKFNNEANPIKKTVNGVKVTEEKEVTSPIEFDESLMKKPKMSIKEVLDMYSEEEILDMLNINNTMKVVLDYFKDNLSPLNINMNKKNDVAIDFAGFFIKLLSIINKDTSFIDDICGNDKKVFTEFIREIIKYAFNEKLVAVYDVIDDIYENDKKVFTEFIEEIVKYAFNEKLVAVYDDFHKLDIDNDDSAYHLYTDPKVFNADGDLIYEKDDYEVMDLSVEDVPITVNAEEVAETIIEEKPESTDDNFYTGFKYYAAKVINEKDIFQDKSRCKVLAIIDENGEMVSNKDKICVVDLIDNKSVDSLSIVSTKWLNPILEKLSPDNTEDEKPEIVDVEVIDESETDDTRVVYSDDSDKTTIADSIPNGIFPPNSKTEYSVNGVKGE